MSWKLLESQGASSRFSGKYLAMRNFKLFFLIGVLASVIVPATAGNQHGLEQPLAVPRQKGFNTSASSGSFHAFRELAFLTCAKSPYLCNCLLAGNAAKHQLLTEQNKLHGCNPHCWSAGCWDSRVGAGQEDSCESPLGRSCGTYSLTLLVCSNRTKR